MARIEIARIVFEVLPYVFFLFVLCFCNRWHLPFRDLCALDLSQDSAHTFSKSISDTYTENNTAKTAALPAEAEVLFLEQFASVFEDAVCSVEKSKEPLHKRFDDPRHRIHGILTFFWVRFLLNRSVFLNHSQFAPINASISELSY